MSEFDRYESYREYREDIDRKNRKRYAYQEPKSKNFIPDTHANLWEEGLDKLGTYSFAKELSKSILNYDKTDSLVIGLCGDWGSGKTSIIKTALNYIDEYKQWRYAYEEDAPEWEPYDWSDRLNVFDRDRYHYYWYKLKSFFRKIFRIKKEYDLPIIIEFHPWNFSNQDQLISQFFRELIVKLGKTDYNSIKKTTEKLEIYASFFESVSMVFPPLRLITRAIKKYVLSIKNYSTNRLNDLDEIKKELDDALRNQRHKIIIFIDDIDRLNKSEIRQIFQLVKSLADFPNTIYVLAFDKEIVANALRNVQKDVEFDISNNLSEDQGLKYLEKVVQVIFEVPKISRREIKNILIEQLNHLTEHKKWNETQWANIWDEFTYFFKNIRDINRYFNTLIFNFESLKDEVNLSDLFVITAFQVFIPEIYKDIRNNKNIFTNSAEKMIPFEQNFIEHMINKGTNKIPKEKLTTLLISLFPRLNNIYGDEKYQIVDIEDNRIYNSDKFDIYFKLYVPDWEFSQKEFNRIVGIENTYAHQVWSFERIFKENLEDLRKNTENKKIYKFFQSFQDPDLDIPHENVEPIIKVTMNISDSIPFNEYTETEKILCNALINLGKYLQPNERITTFKKVINDSNSIYIPIYFIDYINSSNYEYKDQLFSKEQINLLKNECVNKVKLLVEIGELTSRKELLFILQKWAEWDGKQPVEIFTGNLDGYNLMKIILDSRNMILEDNINNFLREITSIIDSNVLKTKLENINFSIIDKKTGKIDKETKIFIDTLIKRLNAPNLLENVFNNQHKNLKLIEH
jgi:predicted KAP-like P-loop ATPase